jgi:hypothetical protein
MLIRSQDKHSLINLDNVTRLTAGKIYGKDETGWLIEVDKIPFTENLGQYSTEAKAIEVLDMIQKRYQDTWSDNQTFAFDYPKVFQMPSDEAVKEGAVKDE